MSKINMIFFVLFLTVTVFLSGCKTFDGNESVSLSSKAQQVEDSMNNSKKSEVTNEVKISYSLADAEFSLHQPIILNFVIKNGLTQPINLDLGQDRKEGFLFVVTLPNGKKIQLPQLRRDGISRIGKLSLEPQQTYTQRLLLNEWIEFNSSGKHEIEVRLANPIQTDDGKVVASDSSFHTTLEIGQRNPKHLKQVSETLIQRIAESKTYEEASEAALALGYVKDSVVVPYLEKALASGKMVEPIIIASLTRIADKNSVQVLINAVKENPKSEVAILSRSALGSIENQSADPELKEMIKTALRSY